ncbi:2,3-diaminopropionate biosynthesis protein SbnB [Kribbella sp. CA-293567]|uniref:2,3-diaminopropionate biosynthesis protein SbnB n=1 Tax=Kribbella sp. CA-293567 TaxID=3002436 RepID=UPI0022DD3AFA|nr:2,3-diaminopropionate biosynthesis protein SbnB [Kribbella sp. CA-293567]WBQ08261.1 2,3-diaminopropionate biosynthesis protein SbnB [Kribbella sp. CA-293567]
MIVLGYKDVQQVLSGTETETLEVVRSAYRLHDEGRSAVPHSVFLRFPGDHRNRIIGLPAFAGGDRPVAGMKWIASFPGNVERGLERASAAILLNSLETGHPEALIEGSQISARRTAASAAVAAQELVIEPPAGVTLVGAGVINLEIFRFLTVALPSIERLTVFDTDRSRAESFIAKCQEIKQVAAQAADSLDAALAAQPLVSFATTAIEPHTDLSACRPGTVVLHISLRDLHPEAIVAARNIVDDADHVCREGTSLFLAEQQTGGREFIDAPIGALLRGTAKLQRRPDELVVYSPFGLGVLDMALADHVRVVAEQRGLGATFDGFVPS